MGSVSTKFPVSFLHWSEDELLQESHEMSSQGADQRQFDQKKEPEQKHLVSTIMRTPEV